MVGLTTLGQPRLSEGAQPYPIQQTETLAGGFSFTSQVSAVRSQVRALPSALDSAILHFRCQVTATWASAIQASAVSLRQPAPGASCRHLRFLNRQPLPLTPATAYPFSPPLSPPFSPPPSPQRSPPLSPPFSPPFSPQRSPLLYRPFLLCFRRYSTGVHFISRLKRRLKKVTWRKPQAKAMSRTLRSLSRNSRRAACRRSSLTNVLKL